MKHVKTFEVGDDHLQGIRNCDLSYDSPHDALVQHMKLEVLKFQADNKFHQTKLRF